MTQLLSDRTNNQTFVNKNNIIFIMQIRKEKKVDMYS